MRTRSLVLVLFLCGVMLSPAFAQELRITTPQNVQVGNEATLTIQVLDEDGSPITDAVPELSFSPEFGADEISLYNCVDEGDKDNCQPNNRDVEGIYESVILVNELPLTVEVTAEGATTSTRLGAGTTPQTAVTTSQSSPAPATGATATVSPTQVQVGPQPSFWLIVLPFLLMSFVVSYFVIKTE